MIPPKHRPIAGAVACLISLAPIFTIGALNGQSQGTKNIAETDRQSRLEAVSKASLSDNCYITSEITVGAEFVVKGRSQSVCICIVLGGSCVDLGEPFVATALQTLNDYAAAANLMPPMVQTSRFGADAVAVGAAALARFRLTRPMAAPNFVGAVAAA